MECGHPDAVRDPGFLRIGSELARQGVPAAEALDELQALQEAAEAMAGRFTRVFERHMWHDFVQAGLPSEQIAPLTRSLSQLSALAEEVTGLVLRDALRRQASEFLAAQATRLDHDGALDDLRQHRAAASLRPCRSQWQLERARLSAAQDNGPVIYPFTVGQLSCAVISDGQMTPPWEPPLAAFFTPAAGVPDRELHAALAAESRPRATLSCGYNCVLVRTSAGHAVIDTGLGARFLGYGPPIEPLVGRLGDGLASAGVPAVELAAVVFTHLHQDHCRGATWSGRLTFPQAAGFAHTAEIAFWSGAQTAGAAADEHLTSAREAIRLFGGRLRPFGHDTEILPGVRTVDAVGHTPGHTAVLLHSNGERLLCVGDLFYDQLQLSHPGWGTPWDHDTAQAVRARRRLLDRAADEHLLVHAYHMPFPGLGTIARDGDAYKWQPLRHDEPPHAPAPGP